MGSPDGTTCPPDDPRCAVVPPAETGRGRYEVQHPVMLTHHLAASAREVTQAGFEAALGFNPSRHHACGPDCPVDSVSWYDALAYCNRLSLAAGLPACFRLSDPWCADGPPDTPEGACREYGGIHHAEVGLNGIDTVYECEGYRLPTEAEWEYLARAGTRTSYHSGEIIADYREAIDRSLDHIGWYNLNSRLEARYPEAVQCHPTGSWCGPHPAGSKEANGWGVYDISGNAAELVWDRSRTDYQNDLPADPHGPAGGDQVVVRGGNWMDEARWCRSAARAMEWNITHRGQATGFRVVRTLDPAGLPVDGDVGPDGDPDADGDDDGEEVTCDIGGTYPGLTITDRYGIAWIKIPEGSCIVGCSPDDWQCLPDEFPMHRVRVDAFWMTATEITQAQYLAVPRLVTNPSLHTGCGDCPVDNVEWGDARELCSLLGGRLPSEAEWEYAARAGGTAWYPCGLDIACLPEIAWLPVPGTITSTEPVAGKLPNRFGLYDMIGNVWEWVQDCSHPSYAGGPADGSAWEEEGCDSRVVRGNGYRPRHIDGMSRVSFRMGSAPDVTFPDFGFRCARDQAPDGAQE